MPSRSIQAVTEWFSTRYAQAIIVFITGLLMSAYGVHETRTDFAIKSSDGTMINGEVDLPDGPVIGTVIMVSGTGMFDRDVKLGHSNSEADLIFKTFGKALTERGIAVVRYDKRGVNYQNTEKPFDVVVTATTTTETQRDDLAAVYSWTREQGNLQGQCFVLLGHSEGMAHIGRLASTNAPAPDIVAGFGALMESPESVMRWQMSERDAFSLHRMDQNEDGITSNEEVRENLQNTPSAVYGLLAPYLHPDGSWNSAAIERMQKAQIKGYENQRNAALLLEDTTPYPNSENAIAMSSWWKSWFNDDVKIADRLANWNVPTILYYGENDSQTPPSRQIPIAKSHLRDVIIKQYKGLGHSLGKDVFLGPMDPDAMEDFANQILKTVSREC